MNGDDYVIDGDLAFSNTKDALKFYQTEYRKQQAEIEALKDEISTLRYEKSSGVYDPDPVAWFEQDENMKSVWYQCDKDDPSAVPLYTHPAKTLTEIIEKNKPEIEKANAYIKSLKDEIEALKKDRNRIMDHQRKIIFWLETNHPAVNEQLGKTIATGVLS